MSPSTKLADIDSLDGMVYRLSWFSGVTGSKGCGCIPSILPGMLKRLLSKYESGRLSMDCAAGLGKRSDVTGTMCESSLDPRCGIIIISAFGVCVPVMLGDDE